MADLGPAPNFGEGSTGIQWSPPPGWAYVGDAWCWTCNAYVPAIRQPEQTPDGGWAGPAILAPHGNCAGGGKQVKRGNPASGGMD